MNIEENMTIEEKIAERKKYPIIVQYGNPDNNIVSTYLIYLGDDNKKSWLSVKKNRKFSNKLLKKEWVKNNNDKIYPNT